MHAEEGVWFRLEEIGEVATEDHGNAGEVAQGGDDAAGFELGEEAGREAGVAAEFDESHGTLETEAADSFADTFFRDECFGGVGVCGNGFKMGRG